MSTAGGMSRLVCHSNIHQGMADIFPTSYGRQCTAIAYGFILWSVPFNPMDLRPVTLDALIHEGKFHL